MMIIFDEYRTKSFRINCLKFWVNILKIRLNIVIGFLY